MLEKVIIRIIYYSSIVLSLIGLLAITIPIFMSVFLMLAYNANSIVARNPFKIYDYYSEIIGGYSFIKILIIVIVALIIVRSTAPFVEEKKKKANKED